jgi:multiple sugar transport system permease protein
MTGLTARRPATRALLWVLLVSTVVLYGFPFIYLLLTSFKTPFETLAVPPQVLPSQWTTENYSSALARTGVVASFVNSVSTAALVTRMVPPVAVGVPLMSMLAALRLTDTPTGLAIAHTTISLPLCILLMASFFEAVPFELEEAAKVDGCSRPRALWSVVIPVVSGGVAVTAIFAFLASWNEFLFAILLTSVRAQTTPIVIANFQTQFGLDWGPMTALAALYSIPVIVLTLVLQRHIVAGLTLGAVKG